MNMVRIIPLAIVISLTVEAVPALAQKAKMSCEERCRTKHCAIGTAARTDNNCMATCVPKCNLARIDKNLRR
jgi:hypothetical protein